MYRKIMMWLGVKPVLVESHSIKELDGDQSVVTVTFRVRRWATEEDVDSCRDRFLREVCQKYDVRLITPVKIIKDYSKC